MLVYGSCRSPGCFDIASDEIVSAGSGMSDGTGLLAVLGNNDSIWTRGG